tara:strand:- start:20 stop:121 length:102 start_codon:yes stop_codon:yes gene_type:complete
MKIKVEIEIDSDKQDDAELIEQLMDLLKELKER